MATIDALIEDMLSSPATTSTRESILNSLNSREVYKHKKIKRENYVSRTNCEERDSLTSSPLGLQPQTPQTAFDNIITPATTSSRITGLSVQHVKTDKGIKLNIAVQTDSDVATGEYVELTAELKRHSRLRELKRYAHDSYEFEQLYISTIETLKQLKPAEGKNTAIGRVHARGVRGQWFADIMAVATLDDSGIATNVFVYANGEEIEIPLTGILSPAQQRLYHSTGIYGHLKSHRPAPTLATAKRKTFNPN